MKMKKYFYLSLALSVLSTQAFAQMTDDDCNPEEADCDTRESRVKEPNPTIYPAKPFSTALIQERLQVLTESTNYLWDIREMERRGLNRANTKVQPWGGSFWPLLQGGIGNTYQNKDTTTFIFSALEYLLWQENVKDYRKRQDRVHPRVYDLDEKELAKLAPSEKYDLLLGDTSFDLTNRVWDYTETYGRDKKWGYLINIDMPEGYRLPTASKFMATWEGICHGWALAAGFTPRPENTVWVTLPNNKRMPFYPNDIKALASMMVANSNIQDNVLLEGNRCNRKKPDVDQFGRYIDTEIDKADSELIPRCADVHPAIFHTTLVNVMGIEGRSIVVDHNPKLAIANQPVGGYEYRFFNPMTGRDGDLRTSMLSIAQYGNKDLYKPNRNPETTHIVGVRMNVKYIDWELPKKKETNGPADDKVVDFKFNYDLEINAQGKIVGGQWREKKTIGKELFGKGTNQPDYFWLAPRDFKNYFPHEQNLPAWNPRVSSLPPAEWKEAARSVNYHGFMYEESKRFWGVAPTCQVLPENGVGEPKKVACEYRYPRPRPLTQVVDQLIEMSRN